MCVQDPSGLMSATASALAVSVEPAGAEDDTVAGWANVTVRGFVVVNDDWMSGSPKE